MNLDELFPFKSGFRPRQREIIEQIIEGLENHNYIFLEAPTGLGKSAVAYTVANWARVNECLSHIIVNDKYLQDQYIKDFPTLAIMKGRSNYYCPNSKNEKADQAYCVSNRDYECDMKPQISREKDQYGVACNWDGVAGDRCPYWVAKDEAIHTPITIQNYDYYLNEQVYAQSFSPRYFAVFDEAHTIESAIMKFVEKEVTQGKLDYFWSVHNRGEAPRLPPITNKAYDEAERWLEWLQHILDELSTFKYEDLHGLPDQRQTDITYELDGYKDKLSQLIEYLATEPENWSVVRTIERLAQKATFKPVMINDYAYLLFEHTSKALLMSATILSPDNLKRWLGIDEEIVTIRIGESNFPAQNRPIIKHYVGRAHQGNMEMYLPLVVKELDEVIIPSRLRFKGVVHTHTNKTAYYILKNSKYKDYMMSNVGFEDRATRFQEFFDAPAPKIMVTPSMKVGVDLKDDRARWQVLVKTPYPYLGDPQIRKRLRRDQEWYNWQTLITLIQTCGRVCRSEKDWGETFLFDEKFDDLLNKNVDLLPGWFSEAIQ